MPQCRSRVHMEGYCTLLACKFAYVGCMAIMSRKNFAEHLRVDNERHDRLCKERVEQLSAIVLTSQLNTAGGESSETGRGICYMPWLFNPCLKRQPC